MQPRTTTSTSQRPKTHPSTIRKSDRNNNNNNNNNKNIKPNNAPIPLKKKRLPPWIRKLIIPAIECPDCKENTKTIDDPKSGRKICTNCGLVLENCMISDQSEWRTFADNDRSGPDPNRVGAAQHYLLQEQGDLSTTIGFKENSKLSTAQRIVGGDQSHTKLSRGIRDIGNYCSRLSLPKDVTNFAGELFKELTSKREMKGKRGIVMVATCVYIAAKQCHCDRPLKELCEEFSVDRSSVRKIHTEIHKLKSADMLSMPVIHKGKGLIRKTTAEIFAERYANELKLNVETIKHLKKISRKIMQKGLLAGKQPATIGAAAVYLTCIVSPNESERRCYKEISAVSRVSESTISNSYKKHLFLHRKTLIPEGYADPLRIANLTAK